MHPYPWLHMALQYLPVRLDIKKRALPTFQLLQESFRPCWVQIDSTRSMAHLRLCSKAALYTKGHIGIWVGEQIAWD